jgi:hypothetical protein
VYPKSSAVLMNSCTRNMYGLKFYMISNNNLSFFLTQSTYIHTYIHTCKLRNKSIIVFVFIFVFVFVFLFGLLVRLLVVKCFIQGQYTVDCHSFFYIIKWLLSVYYYNTTTTTRFDPLLYGYSLSTRSCSS